MILWTLLSVVLCMALAIIVTLLSGGPAGMLFWSYWNPMPCFMIVCEILLAFCFGFAKDMRLPFFTKNRLEKCTLSELKNVDLFFDFAIKLNVMLSLFIVVVVAIPFMYAWMDDGKRQLMGYNFAAIIEGPLYGSFFILILLPLKSRVKNRQINFMFESDEVEVGKENQTRKTKNTETILRIVFFILWAIISIFVLLKTFTRLDKTTKIGFPIDMPSMLYLIFAVLSALFVSGQFKNLGCAFASVFVEKKISVAQNEKNIEAVSLVMQTILASGILSTMIGFYAMLLYLERKEWLAPNFYIAVLPTMYAVFLAIILECVIASLKKKNQ